jgi:hypothetical protein
MNNVRQKLKKIILVFKKKLRRLIDFLSILVYDWVRIKVKDLVSHSVDFLNLSRSVFCFPVPLLCRFVWFLKFQNLFENVYTY